MNFYGNRILQDERIRQLITEAHISYPNPFLNWVGRQFVTVGHYLQTL